jgi:hypothetical protein
MADLLAVQSQYSPVYSPANNGMYVARYASVVVVVVLHSMARQGDVAHKCRVVRLKKGTWKAKKAADERRHVSLSVSYIVSAPGWVFDEDELDPLPAGA